MANFLAWSHSRRKTFLECPKQLWHTAVAKKGHPDRIEFEQSQAMVDGNNIDNALTKRISTGAALPPEYTQWEAMCQGIIGSPGTKLTQMKIAFDQVFNQCGYMDWDKAWLRVIYDLAIVNPTARHAFIWDWKNGQVWLDTDQLKLFAATGFLIWPEVDTIDTSYIWLKHGVTSDDTYRRRDLPQLWADLLPDVERMQASFQASHWPAAPKNGKRTCAYCPVNKKGMCTAAAGPYKGN